MKWPSMPAAVSRLILEKAAGEGEIQDVDTVGAFPEPPP